MRLYTDLFTKSITARIYKWSQMDQKSVIQAIRREERYKNTNVIPNIL